MLPPSVLGRHLLSLEVFKNGFGGGHVTDSIWEFAKTVSGIAECLGATITMYQ